MFLECQTMVYFKNQGIYGYQISKYPSSFCFTDKDNFNELNAFCFLKM